MTMNRFAMTATGLTLVVGIAAGCKMMKADPAPDSGFLAEPENMEENRERAPFHRMWAEPTFDALGYDSILVAPVNTDFVLEQSTWAKANPRNIRIDEDLEKIALEMRETVIEAFREAEENRLAIVDTPGDKTLILELALTELVPSKAFLGLIGVAAFAAPPVVGAPAGAAAAMVNDGWMAIEGRVRDGDTRRVVAMFADREKAKTRILDLQAVTWYGHAHEIIRDWAGQFVQLANTPKDVQVEDSSAFTLKPW